MKIINECNVFASQCKELASCLHSYADYLKKTLLRMQNVRKKDEDQTNNQASPFTVVKSMLV